MPSEGAHDPRFTAKINLEAILEEAGSDEPSIGADTEGDQQYEVERILQHKRALNTKTNKTEDFFQVKWRGYDDNQDLEWVARSEMDAPDVLRTYRKQLNEARSNIIAENENNHTETCNQGLECEAEGGTKMEAVGNEPTRRTSARLREKETGRPL